MYVCINGCTHVSMHACVYACMCVCMHTIIENNSQDKNFRYYKYLLS